MRGLSSWLLKASLAPRSGNSLTSLYEQVGRNKTPSFLSTQLGKQYCHVKASLESFNRSNLFTRLNSISITNNSNLLYMLDPILIGEFDRKHQQSVSNSRPPPNTATTSNIRDQQDALNNLFQISTSLSQRDHFNLLFSTNIERVMIANLPTNSDSYYYFTQVSLEGLLKFLGQWNREYAAAAASNSSFNTVSKLQEKTANLAESILTNIVSSGNSAVDEVSTKTANAFNSIIRLAENLTDSESKAQQQQAVLLNPSALTANSNTTAPSNIQNVGEMFNQSATSQSQQQQAPFTIQAFAGATSIQRSFNRNNLDIGECFFFFFKFLKYSF